MPGTREDEETDAKTEDGAEDEHERCIGQSARQRVSIWEESISGGEERVIMDTRGGMMGQRGGREAEALE